MKLRDMIDDELYCHGCNKSLKNIGVLPDSEIRNIHLICHFVDKLNEVDPELVTEFNYILKVITNINYGIG